MQGMVRGTLVRDVDTANVKERFELVWFKSTVDR